MRFAVAAVLMISLSACGGGGDDQTRPVEPAVSDEGAATTAPSAEETTATQSAAPEMPTDDDLAAYFDGVISIAEADVAKALKLAEPGSAAAAFAEYRLGVTRAITDAGRTYDPAPPASETDAGFRQCADPADKSTCLDFEDLKGRDGKLVTYTIGGTPLGQTVRLGPARPTALGGLGTFRMVAAYVGQTSGNLNVVVEFKSKPGVTLELDDATYGAAYRDPSGRQVIAQDSIAASQLGPDALSTTLMVFPNAKLGGTVSLQMYATDSSLGPAQVTFPTG